MRDDGRRRRGHHSGGRPLLYRSGGARLGSGFGLVFRLGDDAVALELVVRVDDALMEDARQDALEVFALVETCR